MWEGRLVLIVSIWGRVDGRSASFPFLSLSLVMCNNLILPIHCVSFCLPALTQPQTS